MQKSYLPGALIREIRKRKGLRQSYIQSLSNNDSDSQVTLSRIENLRQDPMQNTLIDLLSKVELPYEQFFCPHMEDQPADAFVLRHQISYLLEKAEGDEIVQKQAQKLITELKSKLSFDSLINKQLWINLQTKLDTITGSADEDTLQLILEGIDITYPEFNENDFNGEALIFYEGDLMLSLVRFYENTGELDRSMAILLRMLEGYKKQPLSEMHKEILLGEIHNILVRLHIKKGNYDIALEVSEDAISISKKQTGNSQLPYSIYLRALAVFYAKGRKEEALALMRQAYFAFSLLKASGKQKHVIKRIRELFQADFETYNTEDLKFDLPNDFFNFASGSVLAVDNIGKLLRQFRLAAGAKQSDVYKGICSRSFYSRIESGERSVIGFFILEALMQRLGRDISLYVEYFSSMDEWEESRLRMQYLRELYIGNKDDAQKTLGNLMALTDVSKGLGKQFILFSRAIANGANGDYDDYLDLLHEALEMTVPDFDEKKISEQRLTFNECNIINAIANFYAENGQVERGIAIYMQVRESMNEFYVDDSVKVRYYLTLLSNLTLEHYNTHQYEKALEFANESESICERHSVLFLINGIAHLKALCLQALGRKEEAIAYAAMAFFSGNLTANESDLNSIEEFAKEEFGISFSNDLGFVFHKDKSGVYAG